MANIIFWFPREKVDLQKSP